MRNVFLLIMLACSSTIQCWSQKNGTLHLSLGGALPVGKFASKDAGDPASGLANLGSLAEIGYSHPVGTHHWGITVGISGRLNGIDNKANTSLLQQTYPGYSWSVPNSHWKAMSAMTGVYYHIPITPKFDIQTDLSLGAAICYIPDYTLTGLLDTATTGPNPSDMIVAKVNKVHTTTFSARAGAGMIYHLNRRLQLLAHLDFWYLKPNFKNVTQTLAVAHHLVVPGYLSLNNFTSISYYGDTHDYKQNMSTINLSVGLGLSL